MTRMFVRFALLTLGLTLCLSAFAKPKSESITLYHDATLNGTNIPAGDYVVKYDAQGPTAQVKFVKGNKEVASATGQVKTLPKKVASSQVVVNTEGNTRTIAEIDLGGKDTAISFEASGWAAGK